jgi:hypothetical protein
MFVAALFLYGEFNNKTLYGHRGWRPTFVALRYVVSSLPFNKALCEATTPPFASSDQSSRDAPGPTPLRSTTIADGSKIFVGVSGYLSEQ